MMDVASRIRFFREEKGLSVNKLANLSGVSQSYVREIELGNKQPTIQYLEFICYGLGITLQEFFCEEIPEDQHCYNCPIKQLTLEQRRRLSDFITAMLDD